MKTYKVAAFLAPAYFYRDNRLNLPATVQADTKEEAIKAVAALLPAHQKLLAPDRHEQIGIFSTGRNGKGWEIATLGLTEI
jgi:hypothetical protein